MLFRSKIDTKDFKEDFDAELKKQLDGEDYYGCYVFGMADSKELDILVDELNEKIKEKEGREVKTETTE